jgi:hypothetical protein
MFCSDEGACVRAAKVVRPIMRRNRLPVSPLIYGCVLELIASKDAISHFYNVINELRRRVSTLEKKSKPLAKKR